MKEIKIVLWFASGIVILLPLAALFLFACFGIYFFTLIRDLADKTGEGFDNFWSKVNETN